ncbi:DUF502 domain-containing protein [Candidatus Halobonum tyrrellensis]|uniref:DUF502 domain-containing protein n=1 Tax=Candidatus Halobonum tyrrellensis G22 TaxID=1324957 RepID=V4HEC1_9EURY|nr:DUF502 domain-containing protein [Candidatus Halobonum tyrrellensis]ESP88418.1 hypothetical protein K933_08162 [Candidatus Halobonum tyrrellensis G22]
MAGSPSSNATESGESGDESRMGVLDVLMTGVAVLVPIVVTVYVLDVLLRFVIDAFQPFIGLLEYFDVIATVERNGFVSFLIEAEVYGQVVSVLTELIAVLILVGIVLLAGLVGRHRYGKRAIDYFDLMIAAVPGIGTVYKSARRMGDVMLDDEGAQNFKSIKLVECLNDDMYTLAFETSDSPPAIEDATGHEKMVSVFIPMAPNPVTGGFLTYLPEENVHDVDMTIDEGVRSILTSGIAADDGDEDGPEITDPREVTMADLKDVTDFRKLEDAVSSDSDDSDDRNRDDD